MRHFHPGILVGLGVGGSIARITFLQHPSVFLGAISLGEPRSAQIVPCQEGELNSRGEVAGEVSARLLTVPTHSLQSALNQIESSGATVLATRLEEDLPLIPYHTEKSGERFAIFYSGDGGWANIDREVASRLVARGIPVVGVDSLRYFWSKKSPEEGARDLSEIIDRYSALFKRSEVILLGFSFGADVLPGLINRLPQEERARVKGIGLISPSLKTDYEIHISGWIGMEDIESGEALAPEVERIEGENILCIFGVEDAGDSLCEVSRRVSSIKLPGDHHLNGDYDLIVQKLAPLFPSIKP